MKLESCSKLDIAANRSSPRSENFSKKLEITSNRYEVLRNLK